MSGPSDSSDSTADGVKEADRRNGEPDATESGDEPLEQHPADGQMPSDPDVQAERQEPLDQ